MYVRQYNDVLQILTVSKMKREGSTIFILSKDLLRQDDTKHFVSRSSPLSQSLFSEKKNSIHSYQKHGSDNDDDNWSMQWMCTRQLYVMF